MPERGERLFGRDGPGWAILGFLFATLVLALGSMFGRVQSLDCGGSDAYASTCERSINTYSTAAVAMQIAIFVMMAFFSVRAWRREGRLLGRLDWWAAGGLSALLVLLPWGAGRS